jgi:hypothetical protein
MRYHTAFTIPLPLFPRIIQWYTEVSRNRNSKGSSASPEYSLTGGDMESVGFLISDSAVRVLRQRIILQPGIPL